MKIRRIAAALALVALTAAAVPQAQVPQAQAQDASAGSAGAEPSEAKLQAARGLVKGFMSTLKGELQAAIKSGGPTEAISVCAQEAPGIAGTLSTRSGWSVGRTALKVRNPRNAPSVRERAVLMDFLARAEAGEDLKTMESATILREGDRRYLHYMKAIPTGEVCTTCHGTDVKPEVKQAIAATYPSDAATGFAKGDLRGAFTFVKPLPVE
jgi:hypothetical protein